MATITDNNKRKRPVKKIIGISIVTIVVIVSIFLYGNFNRLLSEALLKSFDSNIASDVYELKFEKLRVNIFEGSLRVVNVVVEPRETPWCVICKLSRYLVHSEQIYYQQEPFTSYFSYYF